MLVYNGGVVDGLVVSSGATLRVSSDGTVNDLTLLSGGTISVGGTTASPAIVSGGEIEAGDTGVNVLSGGYLEGITVDSGATITGINTGAVASGLILEAGATENIITGGIDSGAILSGGTDGAAGAQQNVEAGASAVSATLYGNAVQLIAAGASAVDTTLSGGGSAVVANQVVSNGGYASNTTILSGAEQQVQQGGSACDITVSSGGESDVQSGGVVSGVTVDSSGFIQIAAGATASNITLNSGGSAYVLDNDGVGATVDNITVASGAILEIGGTDDAITNLTLSAGAELLIDLDPSDYTVSYASDAINILDSTGATADTISLASPIDGASDFTQTNATGSQAQTAFELTDIACYCPGTRIAVQNGEAPIETLQIGDLVRTASGALRPVRWIGRRSYAPAFVGKNKKLLPVTIKAGALASNVPVRDLSISPLHAMYVDGVLIPASSLVNGISIVQDEEPGEVSYIHLELESHDLLMAEGTPSETYVEDGSRGIFQNAADYYTLYPDAGRAEPVYCAPRVEGGEQLAKIWHRLAERARLNPDTDMPRHEQAPMSAADAETEEHLHGWLDFADRRKVSGWAWNQNQPWDKMQVDIFVDDEYLTTVSAADHRPDLVASGFGTGWAGFSFAFTRPLDPSVAHTIAVRYAGTDRHLNDSPRLLAASDEFNDELEAFVTRAISGLETDEERSRALRFVAHQADLICQAKAERDAGNREKAEHDRIRRLAGKSASKIPKLRRALVIDEQFPRQGHDAGSEAICSHIRALGRLGYHVTFTMPSTNIPQDLISVLEAEGVSVATAPFYASPEDLLRRQAGTFDVVYLHRAGLASSYAGLVRRYMSNSRLIYSVADLHYLRMARQAAVEGNAGLAREAGRMRTLEVTSALMSDVVVTHSAVEAEELRRLMPALKVHVVPWDIAAQPVKTSARQRQGVAFLGHYRHAPNRDAADWLVREIMPLVWQQAPHIRCVLAGTDMDAGIEALARAASPSCGGVEVTGRIENLRDGLFEQVRLGVAPLRYGAGIKGKVLETFAAGLPCVMTPMAAEGIDLPGGLSALVQKDAKHLAAEIVRLHDAPDLVDTMGNTACRLIAEKCGEHEVNTALAEALGRPEAALEAPEFFKASA
ncbi:hypothetical protein AA21952_1554 [Acetobacter oeni LMG 21952]|nr:hypothetical protein AA21952_1554 [Acetobacter oeni LMG 21952]